MKKIFLFLLLAQQLSHAQSITIRDKSTREPVPGAVIIDTRNDQAAANAKGVADVSALDKSDSLTVLAIGYYKRKVLLAPETREILLFARMVELGEVVFSANRTEEKKADVPYNVEVINQRQIEWANQQTTADVLQNSGSVHVQKSQGGGGSPNLRGFEANKVLIVLDGIRMNNAIYRGGHLQDVITLDAQMLERTEVLFGPSSTIYGSDALGGVMHFYTKSPQFSYDSNMNLKINAMSRFASANTEKTGHVDFNLGFKKIAFLSNVTYTDYDDLRAGALRLAGFDTAWKKTYYADRINGRDTMIRNSDPNLQVGSGYSQLDLMQRVSIKQGRHLVHGLNFQLSQSSQINRYDRLSEYAGSQLRRAENGYGPQKRLLAAYHLSSDAVTAVSDNIRVVSAYQKIDQDRFNRNFNSPYKTVNREDVAVASFNADLFKKIKEKHELRYGMEFTYNDIKSTAEQIDILADSVVPAQTRYPDGGSQMSSSAAYFSNSYEVDKTTVIVSGLRYTYVSLASKWTDTTYNFRLPFTSAKQVSSAVTGNLGVVFKSATNWKAALLASTGFRAPNVDDMGKVNDSPGGYIVVPNPYLKPEYAYNLEFNVAKTGERFGFEASAYYTLLDNVITLKDFTLNGNDSASLNGAILPVKANMNFDRAYIYGMSAGLKLDLTQNVSLRSVVNYTYGRYIDMQTETVGPLDHIPPVFGQTNLFYRASKFNAEFFVRYNGAKRSADYRLGAEDNERYSADPVNGFMPAWFTLNLRLGYNFTDHFRLNVACENITDHHYRVFASGISAPGRNFIVALRYKM